MKDNRHIMAVWLWFFFCALSLHNYVYAAVDPNCNNCQCCINQKCSPVREWDDACGKGCIDGHRGPKCLELCHYEHCKTCGVPFSFDKSCTACYNGYYLGPNSDCISVCPPNCKTCTSSSVCDECKKGFFNKEDSTKCEYSDCPGNCVCPIDKNECTSCRFGYYNKTSNCSDICPTNCVSCTSKDICTSCKNGFYNGYKNDILTGVRLINCTFKCRETCTQCVSYNKCSDCVEGKFGLTCHNDCAKGCMDEHCLIETGICNCSVNFTGINCADCVDGKYGIYCNNSCPELCRENKCSKMSGDCVKGCLLETVVGNKCDTYKHDTQHQQEETNTKLVATATALGSVLSVSLLVNIGLLVYIVGKRIKKSLRAQTEHTYDNQLAISESDVPQTDAAKCIYEEIHRENETDHAYNI